MLNETKRWSYSLLGARLAGFGLGSRLKAAAIHLGISGMVASLAAGLVFGLWYPWPYSQASGGLSLVLLIIGVDLVLGPTLTFVIYNRTKTRTHLVRDLGVIAVLQLAGLSYGLHSVFLARPVAVVFEVDRFRVVTHNEVLHAELPQALPEMRRLSLTGPRILAARTAQNGEEKFKAIELALQGYDTGTRPTFWRPYSEFSTSVLQRARPLTDLYLHYPDHAEELDREIAKLKRNPGDLKFLPLMAREANWSVLIDKNTAEIVGFVPYDGFF